MLKIPPGRLSHNLKFPSPSDGGGLALQRRVKVGVEKMTNIPQLSCFPLPFLPSHKGRGDELSDRPRRGFVR